MARLDYEVKGDRGCTEFHIIATFLPLRSQRYLIPFIRIVRRVQKQLARTEGLARYSLKSDFPHKRFWTLTVWHKKDFVEPFVVDEPHAHAVRAFKEWAGKGAAFVEWTSANSSIDWEIALQKLQNPTFYYDAK